MISFARNVLRQAFYVEIKVLFYQKAWWSDSCNVVPDIGKCLDPSPNLESKEEILYDFDRS
jgi:hypothetical protein